MLLKIVIIMGLFATAGVAAPARKAPVSHAPRTVTEEPGVTTDADSFSEIFKANLEESETQIADSRIPFEFEFAYSSAKITESKVINDYYDLDLSKQLSSLSMFRIYASYEIWHRSNFFVSPGVGLGYAFQENILNAESRAGGVYRDVVRLKWAPILAGAKVGYRFPWWKASMVFARVGARYEWLSINGALDGINQSYWNLGYNLALGVNLFEGDPRSLDTWFGGVFLSAGVSAPFGGGYRGVKSSNYELGLRFLL